MTWEQISMKQGIQETKDETRGTGMNVLLLYFVSLFGVRILNIILCMSRCGVYACVRRWAICVRPRGV